MEEDELKRSVEEKFDVIYKSFRIALYRHIFSVIGKREGSLSATDFFSVETIYLHGSPTVTEFAAMLNISAPNASYRVKSLIEKGYVRKTETSKKNTFCLTVTEKFMRYYHEDINYGRFLLKNFSAGLNERDLIATGEVLDKIIAQIEAEAGGRLLC